MKKIFLTTILFVIVIFHCSAQLDPNEYGYTDKSSYRYGETVTFYTKSITGDTATSFELFDFAGHFLSPRCIIYGFDPTDQPSLPDCSNTTNPPWRDGYGYASTNTWTVPPNANLTSGYYLLDHKLPVIIKDQHYPSTAEIVIVCPTNTVNAYSNSPASCSIYQQSLYRINPVFTTVSFLRPQVTENLFCKDFLDWIRTWAADASLHNNQVYTLNFISDTDMDDWHEIENAKLLIIPGHSEYWTRQARLNFDKFVDGDIATNTHGKNALILSGNTMWCQVRYESQNQFFTSNRTKLTCYRGANWCVDNNVYGDCGTLDGTSDPLWGTYPWMSTDLKYSVLGSIGSDWLRGGQWNNTNTGHKILIQNSPLLSGITLPIHSNGDLYIPNLTNDNTEYDGTLVESDADGNAILNANHDPVLDIAALGFYQAEMIGYERVTPDNQFKDPNPNISNDANYQFRYCPFLVFKKTFTSGTVANVNSNRWCLDGNDHGWKNVSGYTPYRKNITENIINLMIGDYNNTSYPYYNGRYLFTDAIAGNPGPETLRVKHAYTSVCYSACTDGSIRFTTHGIYLNNAYKVDNGFTSNPNHDYVDLGNYNTTQETRYIDDTPRNLTRASFDATCTTYQELRITHQGGDTKPTTSTKPITIVSLFPNPTSGAFTIHINDGNNGNYSLMIMDIYGRVIEQRNNLMNGNNLVDHSELSAGLYLWQVYSGNTIIGKGKVSIVKQN